MFAASQREEGNVAAVHLSRILPDQQNETLDELNMSQELRVTRFALDFRVRTGSSCDDTICISININILRVKTSLMTNNGNYTSTLDKWL